MFVSEVPLLSKEWDSIKNEELNLDPTKLVVGSNKYAFWKCSQCGLEWKAQIAKRGIRGQGCRVCAKKKSEDAQNKAIQERIAKTGSLGLLYPELVKDWDTEKNERTPFDYLPNSNKYVFWRCNICGNEWKAQIIKRSVRGQGCPVCGKAKSAAAVERRIKDKISQKGSLGTLYPELAKEWNPCNNALSPFDYLPNSNKQAEWICSTCGFEWKARINSRAKGNGCPQCGRIDGKKTLLQGLIAERGSLADNSPDIAAEWDYEKNNGLKPEDFMLNSNKPAWWICKECGYSWKTKISNRAVGRGCPRCGLIKQGISASKPILGINDLQSQAPDLAKELHPTKNGNLSAQDLTRSSNKKVWWLGKCGHEWQASVASRYDGRGCPLCLKEFKISYPEKVLFFYLKKYLPCDVEENYKAAWLKGKELDIFIPSLHFGLEYDGYNWHKKVEMDEEKNKICHDNNIVLLRIREKGAPQINHKPVYYINTSSEKDTELEKAIMYVFSYLEKNYEICTDYKIDLSKDRAEIYELMQINRKEYSLAYLYPEIAKEWHQELNGKITPEYVNAHTHRKYWWKCPYGHEYEMVVKHRVEKETRCPICSSHRILEGYNDLAFKRPDIVVFWDYEKNGELLPTQVAEFSNRKAWWKCGKGHSYKRTISQQTTRPVSCPICKMQELCEGVNDLATLFPSIAREWDYQKNIGTPNMYTPISHKRFNWICNDCGWNWNISINSRCILGHGCPSCAKKKVWISRKNRQTNTKT